jgi:hypothetical protein
MKTRELYERAYEAGSALYYQANQASWKFLQRSISGRIDSKGQPYVRLVVAAACGCVSAILWDTAMLISRQFMASF